uniref:ATP synthase F0 subunit 8 n=1 Tax=Omophron limbatum TaxID=207749 RepID=UPI00207A6B07|nr:ATP synthase F0 subunit 8 [Omophron limbatum]URQ84652.1 ATP synthase F0 subunit 8 [Omophron limbatum]
MPQMAPMNWMFLYLMFSLIFLLFNFMNYYLFMIKNNKTNINKIMKFYNNWKW